MWFFPCTTRRHAPLDRRSAVSLALRHAHICIVIALSGFRLVWCRPDLFLPAAIQTRRIHFSVDPGLRNVHHSHGSDRPAQKLKEQIAPTHEVVFVGQYLFDVAVILDRKTPIYVVDDWSRRAADLPDSIRRQFTEGREFEPASAHVLIGEQELKAMLSEGRRMWIWTGSADLVPENGGLVPVASQGGYTVLRARHDAVLIRAHPAARL
jgi:hypothetical protein